jgi:hypothetical protein
VGPLALELELMTLMWSNYVSLWGDLFSASLFFGMIFVFILFAIFKMDILHALTLASTPFTLYTVVAGVFFTYVTATIVILYGFLLYISLRRLYNATG